MNFMLQVSRYKFWLLLTILVTFNLSASGFNDIKTFENEFNIQIVLEDTFESTYSNISYESIIDSSQISFYINDILTKELRKYPKIYFEKIGLEQIILCQNLIVTNQKRAAMPDPYKNTLFFSIESSYKTQYLIHVLHHEMHHITEYALWQNMLYKWTKWENINTQNFEYGTGGSITYKKENKEINWHKINHPKLGFANLYSTTGQEEDRCEIMALIMTDSERTLLKQFSKKDKYLRKKIRLTLNLLDKLSKTKKNYWRIIMRRQ